jgi:hypothetical protein
VELLRWSGLEGDLTCGEEGSAVEEAALIESLFSEGDNAVSLLFVDGGNGAGSLTTLFDIVFDIAVRGSDEPDAHRHRQNQLRSFYLLFVYTRRSYDAG